MEPTTALSVITGALGDFSDQILPIAAVGLGAGVIVLAIKRGWRLAKSFLG